jgi:two-component system chemotaxis response regulator CheY
MKRVLDVGQCQADHGAIRYLLDAQFGAEVVQAHSAKEAVDQLRGGRFDLVLVNRQLDADGSEGIEIVRAIKADDDLAGTAVMLVTNYADAAAEAVAAGAEPGFGKARLSAPETIERLARFLK